jgi:hypothetical protein
MFAGTGKTTVARALADVLFGLGLKPSNKIVEKSALDLTADHVGQTTTKVTAALKEAKGGVLFIDEAYNLGEGPFGKEACDTIVQAMTSEEFQDVLIVIAGYPKEINDMLNSNSGLKSRFTQFFEFPDWEAKDCVAFFEMRASKEQFAIGEGVLEKVKQGCSVVGKLDGWGNGRDVTRLWEEAKSHRAERVYDYVSPEIEKTIMLEDLKEAVDSMIQARIPVRGKPPVDQYSQFESPMETLMYSHVTTGCRSSVSARGYTEEVDHSAQATQAGENGFDFNVAKASEEDAIGDTSSSHTSAEEQAHQCGDHVQLYRATEDAAIGTTNSYTGDHVKLDLSEESAKETLQEATHDTATKVLDNVAEDSSESVLGLPNEGTEDKDNNKRGHDEELITKQESPGDTNTNGPTESGRDDGVLDEVWSELEVTKAEGRLQWEVLERQRLSYERFIKEQQIKEEDARLKHEAELNRIRDELELQEQAHAIQEALEAEERRKHAAALDRKLREKEEQKRHEELRRKEQVQKRLQQIMPCPAGFNWFKQGCGWRCGGGSHFVSDAELRKRFSVNL